MRSRSGREVPNQFIIRDSENGVKYFQSYLSIIIKIDNNGQVYLDRDKYSYSKTTAKYRNEFLNETTKETEQKIKDGIYLLIDLNG